MPTLVSHPDEVRVLSRRFGQGAAEIDKYVELDGYKAVQKAIEQGPEWVINEMKASGLRGRGGAGFPTGLKWSFVPKTSEKPKYVLVNGDESEPGTCKDHVIFLHDPHAVIEGTMIAGLAIGAKMGFIYLRGEYRYLLKIVEKAVADAYAKGFLGKNIFGKEGVDFDIVTQTGAGAYEVGEESALMESLEGKRGVPRIKPPFPAVVGLYGGPTVINNAETIASAPHILLMGGADYAKIGSERNGGTRLFGISGHVERPGVYELPMGYNLKKAIYEVAGGVKGGRKLKAVVPGGSSCPVLLPDEIDVGLDFDQMGKAGTMLGSGGIVVLDETVSIVEFALRTIKFYQHESCGWCIPCREGTDWLKKTLTRFYNGGGNLKDINNIQYLAENMMGRTFCPLGDAAAMPTLGFIKKFRPEFEEYLKGARTEKTFITTEELIGASH
ncbi:NADH dehydrogenase subunit F [Terriglobus roseus DSM 18391]|uniref:NADH-quinone oxidoreductase subunit F n=1 Tax=Terriglobus roseus (strain DSM 18391 / NRRL B-41598 / KBS 63) TaxID=926566 RepID=I3ZF62_TERRK|nr:NADH-quinone oxidoreductase subunit NuoF [Terriglobus roseus]AFL87880.1 NADH dehydrogenase subunit F [Terriglobus roseus DSM 18391]